MRNILIITAIISISVSSLFSQTGGIIVDAKEKPGLRKVTQKDGTQIFFLYNPKMMDKESVKKSTQELKEEIEYLQGQVEFMKSCNDCYDELVNEINHNSELLAKLKKPLKHNFIKNFIKKLPFKK